MRIFSNSCAAPRTESRMLAVGRLRLCAGGAAEAFGGLLISAEHRDTGTIGYGARNPRCKRVPCCRSRPSSWRRTTRWSCFERTQARTGLNMMGGTSTNHERGDTTPRSAGPHGFPHRSTGKSTNRPGGGSGGVRAGYRRLLATELFKAKALLWDAQSVSPEFA